jgi:hypothetical protein
MTFPTNLVKSLILACAFSAASYATNFDLNTLTPTDPQSDNIGNDQNPVDYKFEYDEHSNPRETGDACLIEHLTSSFSGLTATVEWAPAGSIDLDTIYLKAGSFYVSWDVSSIDWTAYTGFTVTNAWIRNPNGKKHPLLGISHIALDGECRHVNVPDAGATAALLALGLAGVIGLRRRLGSRS